MASFYKTTVGELLAQPDELILSRLATGYANRGYTAQYTDQTLIWERDLGLLKKALAFCVASSPNANSWGVIFEFSIPRKELRIDVVLLIGDVVVILEGKTSEAASAARRQIEEYALLLHYFHKASDRRRIVPILVTPHQVPLGFDDLHQQGMFPQLASYWITPVILSSWDDLGGALLAIASHSEGQLSVNEWEASPYSPIPGILEAATALRSGLSIREIAYTEATEHEIETVTTAMHRCIEEARDNGHHAICFLTGVPGSGKTLVGLNLAHSSESAKDSIHFMSGNGPLVKVLQHLFTQESMRRGAPAPQARTEARTLIENVHVFARYHTEDNLGQPANHAIIFDEAQRAWNRAQNMKKFRRDYSEPEMLLRIMERHTDWAVVIALVGGGQEINDGEAGLEEWGRALSGSEKKWVIHASPEVIEGGSSTAGHRLFGDAGTQRQIIENSALHLKTSRRSIRADQLAIWVNLVLDGDSERAAAVNITNRFPIFMTRDLSVARKKLHEQGIGRNRYGLVGSSGAARLRAEGLEPNSTFHADYPWQHWYLGEKMDIRSSYRCEVFATEFEIQGLELDWIGICWGGDFVWNRGWKLRSLRHGPVSKWGPIKNVDKQIYRRNAYRVLLTRARQGMVIFVPRGDEQDSTTDPKDFDATAEYLLRCGVIPLEV